MKNYKKIYHIFVIVSFSFLNFENCSSASAKHESRVNIHANFYNNQLDLAAKKLKSEYDQSSNKDVLLYLMEAGVVLHTQGNYEKSNNVFKEAAKLSESIPYSVSGAAASFVLSDNSQNFQGENFERVIIYFYLALNSTLMRDFEEAKRNLRKLDYEHKQFYAQYSEDKQNGMARFLDAIISEHLQKYEDSRVQYKNLTALKGDIEEILESQYSFAVKTKDSGLQKQIEKKLSKKEYAFSKKLEPIKFNPEMGELIILNQAGRAARKVSRGKIKESQEFEAALRGAIEVAMRTEGSVGGNLTGVLLAIGESENPIPIFKAYESDDQQEHEIYINDKKVSKTFILNDYSKTATQTFNQNYDGMVSKNVASLATKIVVATAAAHAAVNNPAANQLKSEAKGRLCGQIPAPVNSICEMLFDSAVDTAAGAAAGGIAGVSIEPDLRCWALLPSNFQAKRFFLEEGEYVVKLKTPGTSDEFSQSVSIKIEKGKPFFLNMRSIKI